MKKRNILIVRTDRIGDVVMITPMVRELRRTFPDSFIATLTQPEASDIFLHNPNLDVTITDDLRQKTFWNVVKELRKYNFTHGLLVMPTKRATYQMFMAGIKYRIGVGHILYEVITLMKGVSRHKYNPLRHESDYCMDLARRIGVVTNDLKPEIFITDKEYKSASSVLENFGILKGEKKIFIHTGSGGSSPNWSESKYLLLIKRILNEYEENEVKILLTAREMSEQFRNDLKIFPNDRIKDVSKSYKSLRELISLISHANVLVSSSTGPLHLANALNVGCIGLYCHRPMNCSTLWGVFNPKSVSIEVPEEYCDANCSTDKETCAFENGISIECVMVSLHKLLSGKKDEENTD
jgi:heptosyltransferase-2